MFFALVLSLPNPAAVYPEPSRETLRDPEAREKRPEFLASLEGLLLRDGHPLALLLNPNPDVRKGIDPQALFAFVNQLAAKKNIVLDLSAGSIRVVEIPGWGEFYAIPLAQSA